MPPIELRFFQTEDGTVPVLDWLRQLRWTDLKAYAKCAVRIQRLASFGHELRRPEADYLRDGIYELRAGRGRVNYRILYFFHGRTAVVLVHALTKEGEVPANAIERAIRHKEAFEIDPEIHTYEEEKHDGKGNNF